VNIILLVIIINACQHRHMEVDASINEKKPALKKGDLLKLRWLEGSWESNWADKPLYCRLSITSDSSMQQIEVLEIGDNIHRAESNILWHNGDYYFGRGHRKGYKIITMDENEVFMLPQNEINSIHWTLLNDSIWKAEYLYPKDTQKFLFRRTLLDPDSVFTNSHYEDLYRKDY